VADGPGWRVRFDEVTSREAAESMKGAYLEWVAGPEAELGRGEYFWHEVVGATVSGVDGTVLGTVRDVYRSGGAEVFVVDGGPYGEFDVPAVRAFVRVFAPRRGEVVVDAEALDLTPRRGRAPGDRPKAPRRRSGPRRPKAATSKAAASEVATSDAGPDSPPDAPPARQQAHPSPPDA
jgi:hypothetical protein